MNKTRPKQLSFRVSEEEYQQLQEKISESGKNQQEYILSCVLGKQIVNTDGIKELLPELKRIGNNLNQIAKRCNEGGMLPSEAEVRKHCCQERPARRYGWGRGADLAFPVVPPVERPGSAVVFAEIGTASCRERV